MTRLAGFVLIALIVASMMPFAVSGQSSGYQAPVEGLFDEITGRLRAVLALLESVNPAEAARYREAFGKAIAKVEEAKKRAAQNPEDALAEAYRAQVEVFSEARNNLAKANVTYPPGLVVALDVKASMVRELNNTIRYLKSANVTVEPWVEEKLAATMYNIQMLKDGLTTGALNVSQVAVKLEDVNKNISGVRVYIAKTAKREWVKTHVESFTAKRIAKVLENTVALSAQAMRGDPDALEKIARDTRELENLLAKLTIIGIPEDLARRIQSMQRCEITVQDKRVAVEVNAIAEILVGAGGNEIKANIIIGELMKCLIQPLETLQVPGKARIEIEKAGSKAEEVREKAGRRSLETIKEIATTKALEVVEVELQHLEDSYERYKNNVVGRDEVIVQALLALQMAEQAKQVLKQLLETLPEPAKRQIQEVISIIDRAIERAKSILEEVGG